MTRMCCSHLCSQHLSLVWRLRADRWSSPQHLTLTWFAYSSSSVTPIWTRSGPGLMENQQSWRQESLEVRPSANPPVLTQNIMQNDKISSDLPLKFSGICRKKNRFLVLPVVTRAPTLHPLVKHLINRHLIWYTSDWRISFSLKE